jgi:uncharacterized phage protein gp47/JayE
MAGIDENGFTLKRQDEIKSDLEARFITTFGEDVNISPESVYGQIIGILSELFADNWELAEGSYNAFNPSSVTGITQDNLYLLNGIVRNPSTPSTVDLTFTGTNGIVIPAGTEVSNVGASVIFATTQEVTIAGGTAVSLSESTTTGPVQALAGSLTEFVTPIAGSPTVTNLVDANLGVLEESDQAFRRRRSLSTGTPGQNTLDAIFGQIFDLDGVLSVRVYENKTSSIDSNGLPGHSFMAVVNGGDDDDIGSVVYLNTPAGIEAQGNTSVNIPTAQGNTEVTKFERPTAINIFVDMDLVKDGNYPTDGDDQIRQNIIDYSLGEFFDISGFPGYAPGNNVAVSRLYTPVNYQVQGHTVTRLEIGLSFGAVGSANISIDFNELATFTKANIKINGATG